MKYDFSELSCWVVTEGIAGTENQCIGVAEALGAKPVIKRISLREPWKSFSPYLGLEQWWTFQPMIFPPWPDIVIAGGRKSIAVSRYIKRVSDGATLTVQLQDPRIPADNFDLVAVPAHDALRGENVIVTQASPNRITENRLKREAIRFKDLFKALPYPRSAILIGGNSNTHKMDENNLEAIIKTLQSLEGGLMITVSRRTPDKYRQKLQKALKGKHIYFWDGKGDNPYFGMLGTADYIFVTNDSASMISEAATTGKPVYILPLKGSSPKFEDFYNRLERHGVIRPYDGKLEKWDYPKLEDAQKVANAIEILVKRKLSADKATKTL
jgi:uncharacterized protein